MSDEFLCDKEVAALLKISSAKLRRICNKGQVYNGVDLRKAEPRVIGCQRRWCRTRLMALLGAEGGAE
jgi:hypothetical protein